MKLTNSMLAVFWIAVFLIFGSYFAYAFAYSEESYVPQALMQAQATDGKAIARHAEVALTHAKTADKHREAAIKSLEETLEHGNRGHIDLAKKAAIEAKAHLRSGR